tara:strand:- start:4647 stop:5048 length:402 start_codon:yes stop_codon:yes gene_type:complete
MLLFDWTKVYDTAEGNIFTCNKIMEMIITKQLPKNKFDPLYKYTNINFMGHSFLVHPDILLFNAYRYDQRDVAIYYALSAMRNIADYKATKKITLDLLKLPVEIDTINDNRLLRIDRTSVHFVYEEVPMESIH